jgi:adenylate kinase family enzyme
MVNTRAFDGSIHKVMVVGCAGSGKTTLARRLGKKLRLPVINLDFHFWRPGWQPPPDSNTWREQLAVLAAMPDWVMDGNYSNTYDIRMPRADAVVFLDYPRAICLRRVLWRTISGYGRNRPDLPEGCPERFDLAFLRYVWDFPRKHRPQILTGIEHFGGHLQVTRIGCDVEVEEFLGGLRAN